jgi:hypothetical protein
MIASYALISDQKFFICVLTDQEELRRGRLVARINRALTLI